MENASNALIMAGSVLVAVILISIAMYVFNTLRAYSEASSSEETSAQIEAFNRYFMYASYFNEPIKGYDAYNAVCKALDLN